MLVEKLHDRTSLIAALCHHLLLLSTLVDGTEKRIHLQTNKPIYGSVTSKQLENGIDGHFLLLDHENDRRTTVEQLRRIFSKKIKPIQDEFHYNDFNSHFMAECDIDAKAVVLVTGPAGSGKTSLIAHLLGMKVGDIDHSSSSSSPASSSKYSNDDDDDVTNNGAVGQGKFLIIVDGGKGSGRLDNGDSSLLDDRAGPWFQWFSRFGRQFVERTKTLRVQNRRLLRHVTLVEAPLPTPDQNDQKETSTQRMFNVLVDRADLVLVVVEPWSIPSGERSSFGALLKRVSWKKPNSSTVSDYKSQLHRHRVRLLVNKADTVDEDQLRVAFGSTMWSLGTTAPAGTVPPPVIYFGSWLRTTEDGDVAVKFRRDHNRLTEDLLMLIKHWIPEKVASLREHANRVKAHATLVDAYVRAYRRRKSLLFDDHALARSIVDTPLRFGVYESAASRLAVDRLGLQLETVDREYGSFFTLHPLVTQRALNDLCHFLFGCTKMDNLQQAIDVDLPLLQSHCKSNNNNNNRPRMSRSPTTAEEAASDRMFTYNATAAAATQKFHHNKTTAPIAKKNISTSNSADAVVNVEGKNGLGKEKQVHTATPCPKYRLSCVSSEDKRQKDVRQKQCPKYRISCKQNLTTSREAPLQKSTTTATTTVVSDTTLHRCPKYRKTCKSTSVPTDAATPSVVSAIQSTPTTKHCPIYRKSCNPKQQITTTTTTNNNNNNNNNNRPPESKKRKRHCAKKNRMKKQHIEEQLQLKKTKKTPPAVPGCKIYRKSCSPAKLEPKVQKPRCPKYRKSACINHTLTATVHAAAPTTSLAGDAESLTTGTGSTKPCNRFRLSCQKLLAHLDQSAK
ncbi:Sarcalumenin [Trichinella pseudospiralis]|uniref:Sarcalumenin n=2 Tax=Trichinella pseudospiralis TaxID=6337 RepID=A0A0V1G2G6_TRIPS|nr:Sarcalumenin [Trichinella pseudospiralis]